MFAPIRLDPSSHSFITFQEIILQRKVVKLSYRDQYHFVSVFFGNQSTQNYEYIFINDRHTLKYISCSVVHKINKD